MFKIPQSNKKFKQDNSSDRLGNISQTRNISFDKKGYISLASQVRSFADDTTMTDFGYGAGYGVSKIYYSNYESEFVFLGTKNAYKSSISTPLDVSKDTLTGFPTFDSGGENDATEFSADDYLTNDVALYKRGTSWTTVSSVSNGETLCVFENLNQLAISNANLVYLINTSDVLQNTLTLPNQYYITKMAWNKNKLYISTYNYLNQNAILFEWDGLSSEANNGYRVDAHTIYTVVPYKDGVACVTSDGELLYCNGGFQVLDRFPIYYKNVVWQQDSAISNLGRKVCSQAMVSNGEDIYIGVQSSISAYDDKNYARYFDDFPSGVWCYNPEIGLHHKYSLNDSLLLKTSAIATSSINTTTNVITVSGVTVPSTGTPVFYYNDPSGLSDSSSATPLKHGKKYYTIKTSGTTLKLATTYANALADVAIDLTGTGYATQYLIFQPKDQIGGGKSTVTSLLLTSDIRGKTINNKLFIGGVAYNSTGSSKSVLAVVQDYQDNVGWLITPKLESESIEDTFKKLHIKHSKLTNPEDKIVIKYRTEGCPFKNFETYNDGNYYTNTWVDGNTFTTNIDLSDVKTRADSGIFDEIEILRGRGSGYIAHITSITENNGIYTVNLDEVIPDVVAGDTLSFIVNNWTKLGEITNTEFNQEYKEFDLGLPASWVQFKIELRGYDTTISQILVDNQELK